MALLGTQAQMHENTAMNRNHAAWGYAAALGSAASVSLFTVLNKWLLTEAVPAMTAGAWTYGAAGVALLPFAFRAGGLRLNRPWLVAGWLVVGAIIGPSLYFLGLKLTSGVQGVLLINLEAVFSAVFAFVLFRERMTAATLWAGLAVVAGGIWMSWPASSGDLLAGHTLGNLLIGLGYVAWAMENNLGRLLSVSSPAVTVVCIKALAAGVMLAILGLIFHQPLAVSSQVAPVVIGGGAIALGLSLALFYVAMRYIGTGRAGLISATSALWGVVAAMLLLHESLSARVVTGGLVMLVGLLIFAWEAARTPSPKPRPDTSNDVTPVNTRAH